MSGLLEIRGLTLWQPMAWGIAAGHKPIENRPWAPWKGVTHIAVHAGSKYHREHAEQIEKRIGIKVPPRAELLFGAILCVAELDGHVTESDDPWFSGPFGWRLKNVHALEQPISRKGALGLWKLPPLELENIHQQLPHLRGAA